MPTKKLNYAAIIGILKSNYNLVFAREYIFHPKRKWRLDFALPCCKFAIEIEGGSWAGGGHTRGSGFARDMEKYNNAVILGWKILRFTPQELKNLDYLTHIRMFLSKNPCPHLTAHFELLP